MMVSAAITWEGISGPLLLEKSLKINGNLYLEHSQNEMTPSLEESFPNNNFIFLQDSVPSHCARKIKKFLKERLNFRFVKNVD